MGAVIAAEAVTKGFAGTPILKGVTLAVEASEFVMLTGESGSGKSTLLSLIAGLDFADGGEIVVAGVHLRPDIAPLPLAQFRARTAAMVYQDFHLLPVLDAWDNILLPARLHLAKGEFTAAVERARLLAETFGLTKVLHAMPQTLSGGEKQRLAIIRALLCRPTVLLADEPTGNLDSRNSEVVMNIFTALNRDGQTILMVTHSPALARRGSRQLHLHDGLLAG